MSKLKFLLLAVLGGALTLTAVGQQQWRPVSGNSKTNISGMAVISHSNGVTTALVVHDNKKKGQDRASLLTVSGNDSPVQKTLRWLSDELPVDLEAVTPIPGRPSQFIAFASNGRAFHIKLDLTERSIELMKSFDVPMIPPGGDFEGFDLQTIDGSLIAVWAERGAGLKAGTIFWAAFDANDHKFSSAASAPFSVPFPVSHVRHISEIQVDTTGAIFVTSASDPGDEGPFSSAFYFAGVLRSDNTSKLAFAQSSTMTPLYRFAYHKVEAFDLVPGADGGIIFGTDDEDLGTAIFVTY